MKLLALIVSLLCAPFAHATVYWFDEAPFTTYASMNMVPVFSSTNSGHTVKQLQVAQPCIIRGTGMTAINWYAFCSAASPRTYVVYEDGVDIGTTVLTDAGSAWKTVSLATGLDGGTHTYQIICITPARIDSGSWLDGNIELVSGTIVAAVQPQPFMWGTYGDSITVMNAAHQTDAGSPIITDCRYGDQWIVTHGHGQTYTLSGVAGGKVNPNGKDNTGNIPAASDGVRVLYGTNDLDDIGAGGGAAFQTAYATMIDNIRTQIGAGKPILCLQPLPRADSANAQRGTCETLILAAIAGKANVTYVNTDGWITTGTDMEPDGLHPNAAGYAMIASHEAGYWGNINGGSSSGGKLTFGGNAIVK